MRTARFDFIWRREGDSNPRYPGKGTHDFQSCTFGQLGHLSGRGEFTTAPQRTCLPQTSRTVNQSLRGKEKSSPWGSLSRKRPKRPVLPAAGLGSLQLFQPVFSLFQPFFQFHHPHHLAGSYRMGRKRGLGFFKLKLQLVYFSFYLRWLTAHAHSLSSRKAGVFARVSLLLSLARRRLPGQSFLPESKPGIKFLNPLPGRGWSFLHSFEA